MDLALLLMSWCHPVCTPPEPARVQGIVIRVVKETVVPLDGGWLVFYPDGTVVRCECRKKGSPP